MGPLRIDRSAAERLAAENCGWTRDAGALAEIDVGFSNHNWRVPTKNGDVLLKVGPASSAAKWAAAQFGADQARSVGLAVPQLRSAAIVGSHIVRTLDWVDGESAVSLAGDDRAQVRLGSELGAAIGVLHTAEAEGFTSRLDGSSSSFSAWTDYVRDRLRQVEQRAVAAEAPEPALCQQAKAVVETLAASVSGDCRPVVCHRDLHPRNLIVGIDGSLRAIVDWDMAEAWDAAGEWFKLELFLFDQLPQTRAAFESAYDAAAPTVDAERRRLVLLMESLNVVANADLNSREFTTWAVDQLKRLS